MFALLAYAFIALFTGIALFGHVLLFRDIFFAGMYGPSAQSSGNAMSKRNVATA